MIAIIKYNAGNTKSVQNALNRLGSESIVTDDPVLLQKADKVIFPGVGEASTAMQYLRNRKLDEVICNISQPFLGICLGQQLMCTYSDEGETDCLGIFDTEVKLFPPNDKVPHVGWNNFTQVEGRIFDKVDKIQDVYYVHSYYAEVGKDTIAVCDYILPFSAALQKGNFYATQFHPEKSSNVGEQILKNFLKL